MQIRLFEAPALPQSLARVHEPSALPPRVGVVQYAWTADTDGLLGWLHTAVDAAAARGARIVFLPEVTIGFPLPPLLRRLYLGVGNGGFGPGQGDPRGTRRRGCGLGLV